MKKLNLILFAILVFISVDIIAQVTAAGNNKLYRSAGGADRVAAESGDPTSSNSIFGTMGDWSVDLVISEYTPAAAAATWTGPSHNGMGATGWGSFGAGAYNRASGNGAFVGGFHNVAGPTDSDINGINGNSIGQTAFGYGTQATGNASFSAGEGTEASGSHAVAFGINTTASGSYSTAMGEGTTASGRRSTALGKTTIASDFASLVIGQFNSSGSSVTNSATVFSTSNTAFVIGNGTASNSKSDAFKVMFNGDATVSNDLTVSGDITISSDARLKSNIVSLGATLSKLLLIDGKSYIMNKNGKEKIGILAQDVQEVFPELVSKDENEMLSVNYQGLVPVLINAIKEQEDKISRLEKLVEQLISEK